MKIALAVTNDMVTDQRVNRIATTLCDENYEVLVIGRKLPKSLPIKNKPYKTKRLAMLFKKGPQFYLFYNIRLAIYLIFKKIDIMVSNDLDTLLGSYLVSKLKRIPLVYDSHEFFTELPELVGQSTKKRLWVKLEKHIVPKLDSAYTVCESLAKIYKEKYGTTFQTIRNLPLSKTIINQKNELDQFEGKKIILYQGSVNIGRGLEKTILAMQYIEASIFVIIGRGDIVNDLKTMVKSYKLDNKVFFTGLIPYEQLNSYTEKANLGISLEENLGLNYYYALPNKLFDYIQARIPVLTSPFPEMEIIVNKYKIGETTNENNPQVLAKVITKMLENETANDIWGNNLEIAAKELNWEKEKVKLINLFKKFD